MTVAVCRWPLSSNGAKPCQPLVRTRLPSSTDASTKVTKLSAEASEAASVNPLAISMPQDGAVPVAGKEGDRLARGAGAGEGTIPDPAVESTYNSLQLRLLNSLVLLDLLC